MQPESTQAEGRFAQLQKVTPLSKYLAMIIFIIMPFLGGWVGYTLMPEKEVLVETVTEVEIEKTTPETKKNEVRYGAFVKVDPLDYPIDSELFLSSLPATSSLRREARTYSAVEARKVSDTLTLVAIDDGQPGHFYDGMVLFDESKKQMIKKVEYPFFSLQRWISEGVQITVQSSSVSYANKIVLNDYPNQKTIVLYEESDPNVQLADVCEMGCVGILHYTSDGQIIFSRHQKIEGTSFTKYLETVAMPMPLEYSYKGMMSL